MILNYVQIGTKDVGKLANFYIKVLDFKKSNNTELLNGKEGLVLEAPGFNENKVYFGFIKASVGSVREINDKGYAHTCYETVDVKAAIKRLKKYGGSFQSTLKHPLMNPCVYCKDIDGNVVEFHIPFPSDDCKVGRTLSCLLHLKHDKGIRKETGSSGIKFIHVNIITDDYRKLCDYYNDTFNSKDTGKIKDHSGSFKEKVIGINGVHVLGKHVLLPGFYLSYPTLEIFEYSINGSDKVIDDTMIGINAIGFKSDDLEKDQELITSHGGKLIKKLNDNSYLMNDLCGSSIYLTK